MALIPLLQDAKDETATIIPAALNMVKSSPSYASQVHAPTASGDLIKIPCQKIIALVKSTKPSQTEPLGTGFKVVTPDVEDLLATNDGQAAAAKYTLSAVCTLENLPAYRLDPPRGGAQHALVTITAQEKDMFFVETV